MQSRLRPKVWLILRLLTAPGTCPFIFAPEEQLKKRLRGLEPFPSPSHVREYRKVKVKGRHDPGAVPGSRPLQHPSVGPGDWVQPPGVLLGTELPARSARPHHPGLCSSRTPQQVFPPAKPLGRGAEQWNPIPCQQLTCLHSCLGHWEVPIVLVPQMFETRDEEPRCERRNNHLSKCQSRSCIADNSPWRRHVAHWKSVNAFTCGHTQIHPIHTTSTHWALPLPAWT